MTIIAPYGFVPKITFKIISKYCLYKKQFWKSLGKQFYGRDRVYKGGVFEHCVKGITTITVSMAVGKKEISVS